MPSHKKEATDDHKLDTIGAASERPLAVSPARRPTFALQSNDLHRANESQCLLLALRRHPEISDRGLLSTWLRTLAPSVNSAVHIRVVEASGRLPRPTDAQVFGLLTNPVAAECASRRANAVAPEGGKRIFQCDEAMVLGPGVKCSSHRSSSCAGSLRGRTCRPRRRCRCGGSRNDRRGRRRRRRG